MPSKRWGCFPSYGLSSITFTWRGFKLSSMLIVLVHVLILFSFKPRSARLLPGRAVVLVITPKSLPFYLLGGVGVLFPRVRTTSRLVASGKLRCLAAEPAEVLAISKWSPVMSVVEFVLAVQKQFVSSAELGRFRCCETGEFFSKDILLDESDFSINSQPPDVQQYVDRVLCECLASSPWTPALHLSFPPRCQQEIYLWLLVAKSMSEMLCLRIPKDIRLLIARHIATMYVNDMRRVSI